MGRPVCVVITARQSPVRECSAVEGRKVQLHLKEQVLIGPMLATFIASLSVRYRLSRVKIQDFLWDWAGVQLEHLAVSTAAFARRGLPVAQWSRR
ncbi:MAG: hypothetical protein HC929_21245 [Leptolyngbyaceae cyanobacterium SM2_5_2]|nr:hypothetical protein [Leptolyngbyaceae cyanobacterium SM2_5_2]